MQAESDASCCSTLSTSYTDSVAAGDTLRPLGLSSTEQLSGW